MTQVYKTFPTRLYDKVARAVQTSGTYNPNENMYIIEEELTSNEFEVIRSFLSWCHLNNKTFGWGNYQKVYEQYLRG